MQMNHFLESTKPIFTFISYTFPQRAPDFGYIQLGEWKWWHSMHMGKPANEIWGVQALTSLSVTDINYGGCSPFLSRSPLHPTYSWKNMWRNTTSPEDMQQQLCTLLLSHPAASFPVHANFTFLVRSAESPCGQELLYSKLWLRKHLCYSSLNWLAIQWKN